MYLSSDRGGDGRRLYACRRRTRDTPWEMPARVDGLGTSTLDEAPALDRGQLYLMFASQRGTASVPHLFAAMRPDASAAWQSAAEIYGSHVPGRTRSALFSDGRALSFASRRLTQGRTADMSRGRARQRQLAVRVVAGARQRARHPRLLGGRPPGCPRMAGTSSSCRTGPGAVASTKRRAERKPPASETRAGRSTPLGGTGNSGAADATHLERGPVSRQSGTHRQVGFLRDRGLAPER